MKICSQCKNEQELTEFHKHKNTKDGLSHSCKTCAKINMRNHYNKHIKKYKARTYDRSTYQTSPSSYKNSQEKRESMRIAYVQSIEDKPVREKPVREYISPEFEDVKLTLKQIASVIKNKKKDCDKYKKLFGVNVSVVRKHIERQFEKGMTWSNHGKFGWHIDHIVPLSSATSIEELIYLSHYTNLRPMWWRDNISKGDKMLEVQLKIVI